jgi:CheY-like chemotaxis protein
MNNEVIFIIAEDEPGHAILIRKNLQRAGITNRMVSLVDGQEVLDYFFLQGKGPHRERGVPYLLLLDINMPKVDGVEVLRRIKEDPELCKMPVIMIATTDNPREIARCHETGCNSYIAKPVEYDRFVDAIRQLGLFLMVVEVPPINGKS